LTLKNKFALVSLILVIINYLIFLLSLYSVFTLYFWEIYNILWLPIILIPLTIILGVVGLVISKKKKYSDGENVAVACLILSAALVVIYAVILLPLAVFSALS